MIEKHDKAFWDHFYSAPEYRYGHPPRPMVKRCLPKLRKGRTLDIAMGEGQNAVYLAKNGFDVVGFDISNNALTKAKELARNHDVSLDFQNQNLDFYLFPPLAFSTVVMTFYKPSSRTYREIKKTLCPGGTFVCEGFLVDQVGQAVDGVAPLLDECYQPNELLKYLVGFRILYYEEGAIDNVNVVRCLAEKPTDKDAIRYGVVEEQTPKMSVHEKRAEDLFSIKKKKT